MGRKRQNHFYALIAILILGGLYASYVGKRDDAYAGEVKIEQFPSQLGDWQGVDEPMNSGVLNVLQADAVLLRKYTNSKEENVWFYVGYHRSQKEGQLIHSPRHCYPGPGWEITESEIIDLKVGSVTLRANKMLVDNRGNRRLVLYWYQSQGQVIANEFAQRFYMIKDAIINGRTDGALVRVSAPVIKDVETTFALQVRFLELFYPKLLEYIPE